MDRETIIEVTEELTGRCFPYGDTVIDEERHKSLLLKIAVVSSLIDEIYEAGKLYDRHEYSIQNISNRANLYLTELRDMLCEIDYLPPMMEEKRIQTIRVEPNESFYNRIRWMRIKIRILKRKAKEREDLLRRAKR